MKCKLELSGVEDQINKYKKVFNFTAHKIEEFICVYHNNNQYMRWFVPSITAPKQ